MSDVDVSVVVPTRNRHALVADTVDALLAQDYPRDRYEVIVVDDGSTKTVALDGARVVRTVARGVSAARNAGVRVARGALVCFVDDDVDVPPSWLAAMVAAAQRHPNATCLGGRVLLRLEGTAPRICATHPPAFLGAFAFDLGESEEVTERVPQSCNLAAPRDVLERAGGFPEDAPIYFEEEVLLRRIKSAAGGLTVYVPDAWLWHRRTAEELRLARILRRHYRFGVGEAWFRGGHSVSELARRLAGVPGLIAHSVRHRCWFGVMAIVGEAGHLVGTLRARRAA